MTHWRIAFRTLLMALALLPALAMPQPLQLPEITWSATNPFRLFENPQDFAWFAKPEWDDATYALKLPTLNDKTRWNARRQDYCDHYPGCATASPARSAVPRVRDPYFQPAFFPVEIRLRGEPIPSGICRWKIGKRAIIQKPCGVPVAVNLLPAGEGAAVTLPGGTMLAYPGPIKVDHKLIVALGDSYAAGEGNPHTRVAANTARHLDTGELNGPHWWDTRCHRSLLAWPVRAAALVAARDESRHTVVTFASFACSGASIAGATIEGKGGILVPYEGIEVQQTDDAKNCLKGKQIWGVSDGHHKCLLVSQVDRLTLSLCKGNRSICQKGKGIEIDRLMFSAGGNDINFGGVVVQTLANFVCPNEDPTVACQAVNPTLDRSRNDIENRLAGLYDDMDRTLRGIGVRRSQWLVMNYPDPTKDENRNHCFGQRGEGVSLGDWPRLCWERLEAAYQLKRNSFTGKILEIGKTLLVNANSTGYIAEEILRPLQGKVDAQISAVVGNEAARGVGAGALRRDLEAHGICAGYRENSGDFAARSSGEGRALYARTRLRWYRTLADSCEFQRSPNGVMHPTEAAHEMMAKLALSAY